MSEILGPREDLAKHVKATLVDGDWVDGRALLPRPVDTDGSSVHRMHVFSIIDEVSIKEVRKVSRLTLNARQRFAQINLGDLHDALVTHAEIIGKADPLPADDKHIEDPSHALLQGFPPPTVIDNLIGDLIRRTIKKVHSAV